MSDRAATWVRIAGVLAFAACGGAAQEPVDAAPGDAVAVDAAVDAEVDAWVSFAGTVRGVVTSDGAPVADVRVAFGGRNESAITASDGTFALDVVDPVPLAEIALTAGKRGYWNAGVRVRDPLAVQQIVIAPLGLVDNPGYEFKPAGGEDATPHCQHCHREQFTDWRGSAHAVAALDPMLHDLYNGTASGITDAATCAARGGAWRMGKAYASAGRVAKCYVGAGLLPDLNTGVCGGASQPTCDDPDAPAAAAPLELSVCTACHAPAAAARAPDHTDLNHLDGVALDEGVTCDFCHKIRDVVPGAGPGVNGSISLLRPGPAVDQGFSDPEVMFGPYSDTIAFFMGGSVQPQFRSSALCGGCHQWSQAGFRPADVALVDAAKWPDGLPLQDTWYEWTSSPWAAAGVTCQACHMPASTTENAAIDKHGLPPSPAGNLGWTRPYGQIRRHVFGARLAADPTWQPPEGDPALALLRDPLDVTVTATRTGADVEVEVQLTNRGAGHSIPSGTPTRALFLLVRAEVGGAALPAIGGQTVPEWTGTLVAGAVGSDAALVGNALIRAAGAWPADVGPGAVVRFVAATGTFADDPGIRWFGAPERTPAEKGLAIARPLGEASVIAVDGATLMLDRAPPMVAGARFLVGGAAPAPSLAEDAATPGVALAGTAGWVFGKVMRAADGTTGGPFFRAVDVAADNRIPAGASADTRHRFAAAGTSGSVTISVTLLYRRHPFRESRLRSWPAVDVVRAQRVVVIP